MVPPHSQDRLGPGGRLGALLQVRAAARLRGEAPVCGPAQRSPLMAPPSVTAAGFPVSIPQWLGCPRARGHCRNGTGGRALRTTSHRCPPGPEASVASRGPWADVPSQGGGQPGCPGVPTGSCLFRKGGAGLGSAPVCPRAHGGGGDVPRARGCAASGRRGLGGAVPHERRVPTRSSGRR